MNKILFSFVIFLFGLNSFSQSLVPDGPPTLRCVEEENASDVRFEWLNNHNCGPNFLATDIYESNNPSSGFVLRKSVTNATQVLEVLNSSFPGNASYYYFVTRCTGGDSTPSDTIGTFIHNSPEIRSVSVSNSSIMVTWTGIDKSNVQGYYIYRIEPQGPTLIDSVFVKDMPDPLLPPPYEDVFATPDIDSEEYSVTVFDYCGNKNSSAAISSIVSHQTILLKTDYDSCSGVVNLSWTPYEGWDDIQEYKISVNNDFYISLPATQFTFEYPISSTDSTPLAFLVTAVKGSGVGAGIDNSLSNQVAQNIGLSSLPSFIKLLNVSVINEGQIQIQWIYDPSGSANNLFVERGVDAAILNNVVDLGPIVSNLPTATSTIDNSVNPRRDAYYYSLSAENGCGISVSSDTARTIHLTGVDNLNSSTELSWNEFEMRDATVIEYVLQRKEDGALIDIATFGPNDPLIYVDDVTNIQAEDGAYCYVVDCKFELDLPSSTLSNSSFSNEVCVSQTSRMFIPTAFSPNGSGKNKVFKPEFLYENNDNYSMVVFSRWGEVVFESTEPAQGWDGTIDGELAPQGVYAYMIQMQSTSGNLIPRKGTVLLIR